jgi:hypothetical protein
MNGWGPKRWPPYHSLPWPRYYAASLTGYSEHARKPVTQWYVYDRACNCKRVGGPYLNQGYNRAETWARRVALERNVGHRVQ